LSFVFNPQFYILSVMPGYEVDFWNRSVECSQDKWVVSPEMTDQTDLPSPSSAHLSDPPDGGYGWVCVVAVFFINGFTWGIVAVSLPHFQPAQYDISDPLTSPSASSFPTT
jgi:hypothetical protein